jgi:class 3 adenylate cyclase/tetratricopeptide (TPR) repeat protein
MKCPECGAENTDQSRYCSQCGRQLEGKPPRICPLCAMALPPDSRFCISCGAAVGDPIEKGGGDRTPDTQSRSLERLMPKQYVDQLLAAKGRVSGERRVITILFFDIKGSTAMAEKLDPEEVMEIMNGAFDALSEPIYRYEGTIARLMGDAILCFFGAPITHEDDPARACRCALDVIEAARSYAARLERERGITGFTVRVGINTGLVVVGEVGADLRVEYTAMGDAVNLAARMESAAEPGTILITENTQRLISTQFETDPLGPMQVKGRSGTVQVHRLLGLKASARRERGIKGLSSTLVGRNSELEILGGALAELERGSGGVASLIGEAGQGKSRLVREAHRLSPGSADWVEGRCLPYSGGTSFFLAKDLLQQMIGVGAETPPAEIGAALRRSVADLIDAPEASATPCPITELADAASPVYPYLAHLLGVPLETADADRIQQTEPDSLRHRICQAYRTLVCQRATARPLVIVLEDLHWVDPSSLRLLEGLLPLAEEIPLLVFLVFRQEDGLVSTLHKRLRETRGEGYRVMSLKPLSRGDSERLLHNLLRVQGMPERIQKLILDRSEGNAFYLEEVLRSLLDEGVVTLEGTEAVFSDSVGEIIVPETLTGVIMARIDRLPPTEKRTLQTASVIGRAFTRSVLLQLVQPEVSASELDRSLAELCHREFLLLRRDGPPAAAAPDRRSSSFETMEIRVEDFEAAKRSADPEYVFKHAMTVEVAYNTLLMTQRRDLHRRVGEALVVSYPERWDELAPTLAHHFEKAEIVDKAYGFMVIAAECAADICANQEAVELYLRALQIVQGTATGAGRDSLPSEAELAPVHEGLGDVYYRMARYPDAMVQYAKALQCVDDPCWRATLHRRRGQVCEKWGRYTLAREYFEAGLREMQGGVDQTEAANIYLGLGLVYHRLGQLDQAVQIATIALESMTELGDDRGVAQACNALGIIHGSRSEWDTAVDFHLRSLNLWETLEDGYGLATAHNNIGLVRRQRGEAGEAIRHFEQSVELFDRLGNQHGLARACDNMSQVYLECGEEEKSRQYLERAVTLLAEISVDEDEVRPEMWQSGAW